MNPTTRVALALLIGASWAKTAAAEPMPFNESPGHDHRDAILLAEVALSGASFMMSIHNGRMALRRERSLAWSVAGVIVGAGALSLAASDEGQIRAFDAVVGMGAVITGVARLPRPVDAAQARVPGRNVDVGVGVGCNRVGIRVGF